MMPAIGIPCDGGVSTRGRHVWKHDGELLASIPARDILGANAVAKYLRYGLQYRVPSRVPMGVIKLLEMVQIQIENCQGTTLAAASRDLGVHAFIKRGAIEQISQGIIPSAERKLFI